MIELRNLSKTFALNGTHKVVADNINVTFPHNKAVAVLGRNGAGKSTLLKMIANTIRPDSGEVVRYGTMSWPIGFSGSFHPDLTGLQNTRFVARVYGVDSDELVDFVRHLSELNEHYFLPVRTYSSGMRSRLAFGISMGIHFDTYLVDEITAVGDSTFKEKSEELFRNRMGECSAIMVTHALGQVKRLCDHVLVLENGEATYFTDVNQGVLFYQRIMKKVV